MSVLTVDYVDSLGSSLFARSLKETGFAVVKNHPIDPALIQETYEEWRQFFASDEKHQYVYGQEQEGYFPYRSENAKYTKIKDLKEFYHYYTWGRYPASLSPRTRDLYYQLNQLASTLLKWVEKETPESVSGQFSMPLSKMIENSPATLLRIIHYPPLTGDEEQDALRAAPHEDINLITLLPAATATGLQVKDTKGNWVDISCDPGNIVVNTGDMLQLCSKGYYQSTTHQVVNPRGEAAKQPRLSMPLFLHPNGDVRLSDEHTSGSYLNERLRALGLLT